MGKEVGLGLFSYGSSADSAATLLARRSSVKTEQLHSGTTLLPLPDWLVVSILFDEILVTVHGSHRPFTTSVSSKGVSFFSFRGYTGNGGSK